MVRATVSLQRARWFSSAKHMASTNTYRTTVFLTACLLIATSDLSIAQSDSYVISQQAFVRLVPLFQQWSIGSDMRFSQLGIGLSAYAPLGQELGLSVQTSHASTSGDVTSLSGLADAKVSLNYHIEKPGLVLSCGISLPTGKSSLTQDEFETSLLISNEVFDLQIPNVGQGLSVQPSLAWATSLGEKFSIGAGVSYHYRAKYKPLADYGDYDPGDELLFTAGADVRLGETATLATDVVFTMYGADKIDGENVFASGSKVSAHLQFKQYFGQHELLFSTRYRSRSANDIAVAGAMVSEEEKVIPDVLDVSARFRLHANASVSLALLAEGRFFQQTASVFSGVNIVGVGVAPELQVSEHVSLPAKAKFQFGKLQSGDSITGFELGLGIAVSF